MKHFILTLVTLTATIATSPVEAATDIVYHGSDVLAGWNIDYTVETNGNIGVLAFTDIVSSAITFVGSATSDPVNITATGTNTFYFSNTLADGTSGPSPVSATAASLLFDFSGAGGMNFCEDSYGTCYAYTPAYATDADSVVYHSGTQLPIKEVDGLNSGYSLQPDTYVSVPATRQAFATAMDTAVPEPSTWAMLIVGFSMVGAVMRRRKQNYVTA